MMSGSNGDIGYGGIVGVGVIGIFLIIIGAWLPIPHDWKLGFILLGICIILGLLAGATFTLHWAVGLVFLAAAVIVFLFALKAFSNAINTKPLAMIPMPTKLQSLSIIGFLH
jgi:hypothetical protein